LSFEPCSDIAEFGSDIAEDKNLLEDNTWILPKFGLLGTLLLCFMAKWSLVSTQSLLTLMKPGHGIIWLE
jgi:hypothetical protein